MRKLVFSTVVMAFAAGCAGDTATAPVAAKAPAALAETYVGLPGERRTQAAIDGKFTPINCSPRSEATGSALIGPAGGILRIGRHRLIVPAGALMQKVFISGTVPEGKPFEVDLQPHGLQFRKAAGLILDASSCTDVPDIVYLIDQYTQSPPIRAIYSEWWQAIACPIWHFSGYAVLLGEDGTYEGSLQ